MIFSIRSKSSLFGAVLVCLASVLVTFVSGPAWSAMRIDITKGGLQPLPIAIPYFVDLATENGTLTSSFMSKQLSDIVTADLERSGLFAPLNRKSFLQDVATLWREGPEFRSWRLVGAEAVVRAGVRQESDQVSVDFFLHDVFGGKLLGAGKRFTASKQNWRHVGHRLADEIYSLMTGEKGYFTSRIAFVSEKDKRKWLSIMDQDGANRVELTQGSHLVLTPRFSPNGEHLFYISYEQGQPRIFKWDLYTGNRTIQGDYPGLNSAPSWSPDGTRMAMTLSKDGDPEIYVKDLRTDQLTRMTNDRGIDTSPSWSPDGQQIVFNSNRAGTPQLYIMNINSPGNVQRITYKGIYNAAPSWSPRGDLIAFVQGGQGSFRIAVTDPQGKHTRLLTDSWMDESPTWSPNGRVILFSRQIRGEYRSQLYTIDLTGHNERIVSQGGVGESDPSWSPTIR